MAEPDHAKPKRAWSTFTIKSIDKKERIIEGVASTPNTDRVGDIVEPMGARFKLPMPFLWQHDSKQPIGHVIDAKAAPEGITFRARIAQPSEAGLLKDRLDEAFQSLELGLVRGVSIGFGAKESEPINPKEPWGAQRFIEWDWYELSAVTIPANVDASITNIRSIDQNGAVFGKADLVEKASAVSGQALKKPAAVVAPRSLKLKGPTMAKITNSERIKDLENKRAAEVAARETIHEKAMEENRTKDEAEQQSFDEHSATIKAIDRELADCRLMEKELIATARPVPIPEGVEVGAARHIRVSSPKLEEGQGFMKVLACKLHAHKNSRDVISVAREFCSDFPQVEMELKATTAPGTTTSPTWAGPLVYPTQLSSEFLRFLVAQTFFNKIQGLTRVPFNVRVPRETALIAANWVGEGRAKPVKAGAFDYVSLGFAKTAVITGVTDELARFSSPSIELVARDNLAEGIAQFIDQQFITPSVTAVVGVNPASITNGADTDAASGTDVTAVIHDIRQILFHFQEYNIPTNGLVLLMQPVLATSIGTMMTTLGVMQFPNITADGGSILGIPVITSNNCPAGQVTAIHAPSVLVADDGGIQIDVSREASVEMADNPTSSDFHLLSAFQQNMVLIRAEQYITWGRGRDKGVFYLTGAAYGGSVTG